MNALILLAHGSREPVVAQELELFANAVARGFHPQKDDIRVYSAFLSLGSPTLPEAAEYALKNGARAIDVLPLFLFSGSHVLRDIPELGRQLRRLHPEIRIEILPHIGASPSLAQFTVEIWREWKKT